MDVQGHRALQGFLALRSFLQFIMGQAQVKKAFGIRRLAAKAFLQELDGVTILFPAIAEFSQKFGHISQKP